MKQFHWLLCVAKNCHWCRKITIKTTIKPDSSVTPRGMKTCRESRIELRNLKENAGKVKSEQPCEPKSLDVALNIAGVEKIPWKTCGCGQPRGHLTRVPLWLATLK